MSTNLYEILEIQADATPEQSTFLLFGLSLHLTAMFSVRKAYKKRALQTHPDRVPASEKALAEERFRQVGTIPDYTQYTKLA